MKRTKFLAIIFSLLLMVLSACGGETSEPNVPDLPGSAGSVSAEQDERPEAPAFEETILVDDELCTVKVTEVLDDPIWGYTWKVYLENKSEDKNLMFSMYDCSINGVMSDPVWAESVAAGMKSNTEILWIDEGYSKIGPEAVSLVEGILSVVNDDDWFTEYYEGAFRVCPVGEEAAVQVRREAQDGDIIVTESDGLRVVASDFYEDDIWGYTMELYIENDSERDVLVSIDDCAVNGFMCDPFWAETVVAGKAGIGQVTWLSDDFEANGITEVESLDFTIRISDADDYDTLLEESVSIQP